jgi:hypothetical protein
MRLNFYTVPDRRARCPELVHIASPRRWLSTDMARRPQCAAPAGHASGMDEIVVADLLALQCGVISRRQVLASGGRDHDIARKLRRRVWARVHDGVYVDHTGEPSWKQRAWAAVLYHWPAVLDGASALVAHGVRVTDSGPRSRIEVAVDRTRSVAEGAGISVTRRSDFDSQGQMNLCPPRVRVEHALLSVASRSSDEATAVAVLADACQRRHTTPSRLAAALRERPLLAHRRVLLSLLDDVASGAYSVLERRYLLRVERPHGLPTGSRQRRVKVGRRVHFRDVEYLGQHTTVELDGRIGHEATSDRWADLDRDVDATVRGDLTLRISWKQVLDPCRLAAAVARILIARGWTGRPRPCRSACALTQVCADLPSSAA